MKKTTFFLLLLLLSKGFCQNYALVLSGGGGKGAYEVGAYLALCEYEIMPNIKAFSGTSAGGLNAALFALESKQNVLTVWSHLVPQKLSGIQHQSFDDLDGIDEDSLRSIVEKVSYSRLFNDEQCPKIYVNTTRKRFYVLKSIGKAIGLDYAHYFCLNDENNVHEIHNLLMATSAFPLWQTQSVRLKDGYDYVDGGVSDNLPMTPIFEENQKYDCIFVVHLSHKVKKHKLYANKYIFQNIVDIVPSANIGGIFKGMLNFSQDKVDYLIGLGYMDTCAALKQNGFKRPVQPDPNKKIISTSH